MKYIIAIPDGAADTVSDFPDGMTPLRRASSPLMDELANHGEVGFAKTVPDGMHPGSDVACLSIFGFNPAEVYTGRAPLEAASMGIDLGDRVAYRCNLVTVVDGIMKEFTAGHIPTEEATALIQALNEAFSDEPVVFHAGVQYRHVLVTPPDYGDATTTPPHDILDQAVEPHLPQGGSQDQVRRWMERSRDVFATHPVNQKRIEEGKPPANQVWLWGQGTAPKLTTYAERIGLSGGVITAVDLIRGIGQCAGLDIIHVDGATGLPDTNYEGKAQAALDVLARDDFVCVHVEATDEMGHKGDLEMKTRSVEFFDQRMLRIVVDGMRSRNDDFRLLVLPDHPTPIALRTHTNEDVPFLLYDSRGAESRGDAGYSEVGVAQRSTRHVTGFRLLDVLAERNTLDDIPL